MSGVGEVIAIVSCVAGLIEALDAGCRIVKQIKERRQAHRANGALPPSDELEKTIEGGKDSIQKLVEKGNNRFGPNFEEGDGTTSCPTSIESLANVLKKPPRSPSCASPSRSKMSCSTV